MSEIEVLQAQVRRLVGERDGYRTAWERERRAAATAEARVAALEAALRRLVEIMGSAPRNAKFSEYAYEALFGAADEASALLADALPPVEGSA